VQDLAGKVAVVTGGASGIGRAMAERFAREGMKIVLADVEQAALGAAVDAMKSAGAEVSGCVTDVSEYASVQALERHAVATFGKVHLLCNNAGVGALEDAPLWELELSDWRWTIEVNLWGVIHGVKAFVPGMLAHGEDGHVVNTTSGNGGGVLVIPNTPIYATSKSAVSTLTEALHLQLRAAQSKLRVSLLFPGPHMVSSNIFSAARNRPPEYARERPMNGPPVTLDLLKGLAKQAGRELETTPPAEVAEHALAGILADRYWILPRSERGDAAMGDRARRMRERLDPVIPEL
jgi:NAD(P)-dependent dehydrogenase (short-subunit alcohol dehydrogenase family)